MTDEEYRRIFASRTNLGYGIVIEGNTREIEYAIQQLTNTNTMWDMVDKESIHKAVMILDLFTKTYCRYSGDFERFADLTFRCNECPFADEDGNCMVKKFKGKYWPEYPDFGSMGDH